MAKRTSHYTKSTEKFAKSLMAKACPICNKNRVKATKRVKTRSKYNPTTSYFQQANLQWFRFPDGTRMKICTKCRKLLLKQKIKMVK